MDARTAEPLNAEMGGPGTGVAASLRTIYRLMPRSRKRQLWLVLALTIIGGVAELATIGAVVPFLSLLVADGAVDWPLAAALFDLIGASSGDARLVAATGLFIAAALLAGAVRLALAWCSQSFVQQLGHEIATEIQRRILLQPYAYHLEHNSSEVVASLEQVHQLTYGVIQQLIQAAAATLIALFIIAGIAAIDARTALAASAGFGLIYFIVIIAFRQRLRSRSEIIAAAFNKRVKLIQESLGGIRDVIVDHAESAHVDAFRAADRRLTRARIETTVASVAPRYLIESVGMVVLALIALGLAGSAGGLAPALPIIGALALGAQRLLPLINQLYQGWSTAAANRAIADQVVALLRLPLPEPDAQQTRIWFEESIEFDNVTFSYPGRTRAAVDGLSVVISRGKKIALTGPTGGGKSTFADLLMGLLSPSEGLIRIDGTPLRDSSRGAWQRCVAHVPQSIFLLDSSVARNIALSAPDEPIDISRVEQAAKLAKLEDFIATLPNGLETIIGERGVRLSGGQRQRLGIARALYKQAPVLIFDEATSALDEETEEAVLDALNDELGERTLLIIAHRQSTIKRCEIVLRLEHGRLVQVGG